MRLEPQSQTNPGKRRMQPRAGKGTGQSGKAMQCNAAAAKVVSQKMGTTAAGKRQKKQPDVLLLRRLARKSALPNADGRRYG